VVDVQNLALSWQQSLEVAGGLAVIGSAMRWAPAALPATPPRLRTVLKTSSAFVFEALIIAVLYSIWQLAGSISVLGTDDAVRRGLWIERFEHTIHLPSERSVQSLVLGHPWIVQTENLYYATMHFGVMFAFLIWLFVRHRDRYPAVRWTMALTTLICLVIQLIPVAPPRLLPGFTDTASVYGQSVYNAGLGADTLSAMPSVHVAWAVLVAFYVVRISTSRWRWLIVAHAVITVFVVVSTGNHWWLDGIVAVAVLIACAWWRAGASAVWQRVRPRRAAAEPIAAPAPAPVAVPAGS
jgi:PAP2 superfamily